MLQLQNFHGLRLKFDLCAPLRSFRSTIPFPIHRNHTIHRLITAKFSAEHHNFTISYLTDACGLLPETAIVVSEKVQLHNREKPDSVLELLESHGFSKSQISKLVRKRPSLLLASVNQTLLPKLEFFYSIGASRLVLARALTSDPTVLTRSLQNQIIPSYRYLKSVLLSDAKVVAALKRTSWIFLEDHTKTLMPNIDVLRDEGVPQPCIALLLTHFPETLMQKTDSFEETVAEIKGMGFDPSKSTFVLAIHAISGKGNRSIWNRCYDVYRKWGWTKEEILMAFRKHPHCMILSEEKISKGMEYFTEKMGKSAGTIAKTPVVLFFSLEKRIIPRCSVLRVLSARGLVKRDLSLTTVLLPVEKRFLETFVIKYLEAVPELMDLYQGNANLDEVLASNF